MISFGKINANGARGAKVANALETLAPFASLVPLALNFYGYLPDLRDAVVRMVLKQAEVWAGERGS